MRLLIRVHTVIVKLQRVRGGEARFTRVTIEASRFRRVVIQDLVTPHRGRGRELSLAQIAVERPVIVGRRVRVLRHDMLCQRVNGLCKNHQQI